MKIIKTFFLLLLILGICSCATMGPEKGLSSDISGGKQISEKVDILGEKIASTMLVRAKKSVAVISFTGSDFLGTYLADKLTNGLFKYQDKFTVVDRMHTKAAFSEMDLSSMKLIDSKSIKKLGKFLGADAIVTGSITDLGNELDITIRMIEVETMKVLAVASVFIGKDNSIIKMLGGSPKVSGSRVTIDYKKFEMHMNKALEYVKKAADQCPEFSTDRARQKTYYNTALIHINAALGINPSDKRAQALKRTIERVR